MQVEALNKCLKDGELSGGGGGGTLMNAQALCVCVGVCINLNSRIVDIRC